MSGIVVDTNIPIVANGRSDGSNGGRVPSAGCQLAAIDFLDETLRVRRVALDLAGEIQAEYHRHLSPRGQPGVGDRFYLQILMSAPSHVWRVELPQREDGEYADFPEDVALTRFDRSDRKFAALAKRTGVPVANATDSDWLHHSPALARHGIEVKFVCGCDDGKWFAE